PGPRLLQGGEFQHHDPLRVPVPLEGDGLAAADDVAPAVLGDGWRRRRLVLLVELRVVDLDLDDDICAHPTPPPCARDGSFSVTASCTPGSAASRAPRGDCRVVSSRGGPPSSTCSRRQRDGGAPYQSRTVLVKWLWLENPSSRASSVRSATPPGRASAAQSASRRSRSSLRWTVQLVWRRKACAR